MCACGGTHHRVCLGIKEYRVDSSMGYLWLIVYNLGFNIEVVLLGLWIWVKVEVFWDCWICILVLRSCSFPFSI